MPTLRDTLKQVAYGAARTLIAGGAGVLVTAGWLASSKMAAFEDAALGAVGVVGILAWSAGEKLWMWIKQELAKIPSGSFAGQVVGALEAAAPGAETVLEPLAASAVAAEAAKLDIPLVAPTAAAPIDPALAIPAPSAPYVPPIMKGPFE